MLQGKMTYLGIAQLIASGIVLSPIGQVTTQEELSGIIAQAFDIIASISFVIGSIMAIYGRWRVTKEEK